VLPEFKERDLANRARHAQRAARISDKAMARKPKGDHFASDYSIPAAGRH
jgi:hypothetical protein